MCDQCDEQYTDRRNINNHIKTAHKGDSSEYMCYQFDSKYIKVRHKT